jgi:hypothetical protein
MAPKASLLLKIDAEEGLSWELNEFGQNIEG